MKRLEYVLKYSLNCGISGLAHWLSVW